jgi:hypothetical protein
LLVSAPARELHKGIWDLREKNISVCVMSSAPSARMTYTTGYDIISAHGSTSSYMLMNHTIWVEPGGPKQAEHASRIMLASHRVGTHTGQVYACVHCASERDQISASTPVCPLHWLALHTVLAQHLGIPNAALCSRMLRVPTVTAHRCSQPRIHSHLS